MTIKEFAYSAQQQLEARAGVKFKRAHVYELLAASFGYSSFAALCAESVVFLGRQASKQGSQHNLDLRRRCAEFGYPSATVDIVLAEFPAFIAETRATFITFSALVAQLRRQLSSVYGYPDWGDADDFVDDEDEDHFEDIVDSDWPLFDEEYEGSHFPPDLLTGLENAAVKDHADAHYALALIYMPSDGEDREIGSEFWYTQKQRGRVLTGAEKEWADQYARTIANQKKYELHLREAGRLGNEQALLDLAERFEDVSFFENVKSGSNVDPVRAAEIAQNLGRMNDVYDWLTIGARAGNVEAMRRLIEEFDHDNLLQCWTWFHLAKLLGTDLARDNYYGINEDGSLYDDDVGGPVYAAGRGGIRLVALSEGQDVLARQQAQALFEKIQ